MKNEIALRIEEKYGDLRKSEKIAADYILDHLNRLAELPLDRLAEYSGVSQPTILRMVKAVSYTHLSDFEKINEEIEDVDARYKNPRNLCSGSVRQLNNEITARRRVHFWAFALVKAEGVDFHNSRQEQMDWLSSQGFETVEYRVVAVSYTHLDVYKRQADAETG